MEPEIARRCAVCGASIRQRAAFCPQCGHALASQTPAHGETDPRQTQIILDSTPTHSDPESAPTVALDRAETEALRPAQPARERSSSPTPSLHTARTNLEGNIRGRVDKIRKVSSVVLDQAAYDPSLRFLLVAAGFFLWFLILLIASKLLG